jgi:hypothetical protein
MKQRNGKIKPLYRLCALEQSQLDEEGFCDARVGFIIMLTAVKKIVPNWEKIDTLQITPWGNCSS